MYASLMTEAEFEQTMALLDAHWHQNETPPTAYEIYAHELRDLSFEHVQSAVLALARDGERWMPYAGAIRRKVVVMQLDPPAWSVAISDLSRALREMEMFKEPDECVVGNPECHGGYIFEQGTYEMGERELHNETARPCACREVVREMRRPAWLHPLLREFMAHVTSSTVRDALASGDTTREAQLRNKYEAFIKDTVEQRLLVGLDAPGMRAVERANKAIEPVITVPLRELPA
jgi:hypothetical protein